MKKHLVMNSWLAVCLCVLTVFSGCGDFNFKAKYARTVNMSVPVGQAAELCVETEVGSITVTGADVTDCNITAEITVKAETQEEAQKLAEQVKIEAKPSGDKLSVKVVKPAALKKRKLEVKFKIVTAKQLKVDCSVNVGNVSVSDMKTDKPITVVGKVGKSVNGTIGAGEGKVRLATNVGSIHIK